MSFYDTPLADLDAASANDPGWALPHVMRAGFLLSLTEPSLLAEAGTGTGKTFAYLVPALLAGGKVIISTGTKTLQDQLFNRDLPTVRAALKVPVKKLEALEAEPGKCTTCAMPIRKAIWCCGRHKRVS